MSEQECDQLAVQLSQDTGLECVAGRLTMMGHYWYVVRVYVEGRIIDLTSAEQVGTFVARVRDYESYKRHVVEWDYNHKRDPWLKRAVLYVFDRPIEPPKPY